MHTRGFLRELLQRPSSSPSEQSLKARSDIIREKLGERGHFEIYEWLHYSGERGARDTMRFPYSTSRNIRSREGENGRESTPGLPSFCRSLGILGGEHKDNTVQVYTRTSNRPWAGYRRLYAGGTAEFSVAKGTFSLGLWISPISRFITYFPTTDAFRYRYTPFHKRYSSKNWYLIQDPRG